MKILRNTKRWIKYGWKANHLKGDKKDIRGNNRFVVFDTGLYAENLGDWIINNYCQNEFSKMGINIIHRIPTQTKVTDDDNKFLLEEIDTGKIITGTNVLCKHVFDSNQWQKPIMDKRLSHLILMGVGVDNYKQKMDGLSKKFYKSFLDDKYLHSVRDSETETLLRSIGIENVVNTACPTMWNLTPDFCRSINRYKTDDVVLLIPFKYGNSGIHILLKDLHDLIVCSLSADTAHIDPWYHDVFGHSIGKIKYIVNDLLLAALNDTVLMANIHVGLELILRHGLTVIGIHMKNLQYNGCYTVNDKTKGNHDGHKSHNYPRVPERNILCISCCYGLGNDLAKDQNNKGKYSGSDSYGKASEHIRYENSHKRRCT